jgi:hypothetical protein
MPSRAHTIRPSNSLIVLAQKGIRALRPATGHHFTGGPGLSGSLGDHHQLDRTAPHLRCVLEIGHAWPTNSSLILFGADPEGMGDRQITASAAA